MAKEYIEIIESKKKFWHLDLFELLRYSNLIRMFVKRDFISVYKQTILGPIWFFLQPIFTTLIFTLVFGKIGELSPKGTPVFLYYLSGIVLWQYFADCLTKTSVTFVANQHVFGKVYFPRLTVPISIIISNMLKLGVQLLLFIVALLLHAFLTNYTIQLNFAILLVPYLILLMAGMGLGFGLIISSLTIKYRDLQFMIQFGVQLLMYITPGIIMSYSDLTKNLSEYVWAFKMNPIGPIIETFKYSVLNAGSFSWYSLVYSSMFTIIILFAGIFTFNKTEQNFMDSI
ncbi:MAG: ABC transporter permease [Crocinitomicaceae bacterium]